MSIYEGFTVRTSPLSWFRLLVVLLLMAFGLGPAPARSQEFQERFEALRTAARGGTGPAREALRSLLRELPKGADLHSHLSGSVQVSGLLTIAGEEGFELVFRDGRSVFCGFRMAGREERAFPDPGCREGGPVESVPPLTALRDPQLEAVVRDALTLFPEEGDGEPTGFREFNLIFGRLDNLTDRPRVMEKLVQATMRDAFEHGVSYLELKVNPIGRTDAVLVDGAWTDSPVPLEEVAAVLRDAVEEENRSLKEGRAWPADWPDPVEVRFIVGGDRTRPLREGGPSSLEPIRCQHPDQEACPNRLRQAYYLSTLSPFSDIFVGIDFVRLPEVDFPLERPLGEILFELSMEFGPVNLTLHAGETNDPDWGDHVGLALAAGARRIGHGLNLGSSASPESRERFCSAPVPLEVSLSSNLATNVVPELASHPFPSFFRGKICAERDAYLPVTLNTDDAGVFETNLTAEFMKAVLAFDLSWEEVKRLARNSLLFAFSDSETKSALVKRWEEEVEGLEESWVW